MEKNLNKYLTMDEAAKQVTITSDMIHALVISDRIPYFSDKGTIKVAPADVVEAIDELIGNSIKKARQSVKTREKANGMFKPETQPKAPIPETPIEELSAE
jgi:hypothetical protein